MSAWLMTPPKRYAVRTTTGQDASLITKKSMANWTRTRASTFHLNVGSTPNSFFIWGYFSGNKKGKMW